MKLFCTKVNMIFIDYVLYYAFCLGCYKTLNIIFKKNNPISAADVFMIGIFSVGIYMYMYTQYGYFMMDTFL